MTYRGDVTAGLEATDPAAAYRYGHCREEGKGWWYHCPNNDAHYAAYVPAYCMLRICFDCGEYSAHLIQEKYRPVIEKEVGKSYRKALKFLTLTTDVKLPENPGPEARQLLDAARDFYRMVWGNDSRKPEKNSGAIANLEVGPKGLRLHCHLIVQGSYQPQKELSDLWRYFSGGSYIVDISEISADKAVKEGLKYITKTASLTPGQLVNLHNALKGTRRIRSWGCFYNADIEEDVEERETQCPKCQAGLRYTSELAFEQWRTENAARRLSVEMELMARTGKSLESLLHLTDTNKFFGAGPPTAQISYLDPVSDGLDSLLDDVLTERNIK